MIRRKYFQPNSEDVWNRVEHIYRAWERGKSLPELLAGWGQFPVIEREIVRIMPRPAKYQASGTYAAFRPAMEFDEIAQVLGISRQAASQLYQKAIRKLAQRAVQLERAMDLALMLDAARKPNYADYYGINEVIPACGKTL